MQIETKERFFSFIVKTDFILDDDRRKNAELFEEAFYEKKNLDPQMHVQQENNNATVADEVDPELLAKVLANPEMRALLNSLAKTDHTLANKIEAPHEILRKNPVQYMNMSRIFLFTTIFFTIFPSIIRKIFHCNDYSYPPSP